MTSPPLQSTGHIAAGQQRRTGWRPYLSSAEGRRMIAALCGGSITKTSVFVLIAEVVMSFVLISSAFSGRLRPWKDKILSLSPPLLPLPSCFCLPVSLCIFLPVSMTHSPSVGPCAPSVERALSWRVIRRSERTQGLTFTQLKRERKELSSFSLCRRQNCTD